MALTLKQKFLHLYSDYRRCFHIWTEKIDSVIKLEEIDFQLERGYNIYSDPNDGLIMFYTSLQDAGNFNTN